MDNHDVYYFIKNFDRKARREKNNQDNSSNNKKKTDKLTLADLPRPDGSKPTVKTFIKSDD